MTTLPGIAAKTITKPSLTERQLLDMLRLRHVRSGNGGAGEYAFLTHVRNEASFAATRTMDALTVSLWPSRGLELHGYEVKSSRSDWLRELKDPEKAEVFHRRCDRWSLVVGAADIVAPGELPPTWGLLVPRGGKLATVVAAPKLPRTKEEKMISRSWLVCLLRAAGAVPESDSKEVAAARAEGFDEGKALMQKRVDSARESLGEERAIRDELDRSRRAIYEALGLDAPYYRAAEELRKLAEAVRIVVADATAVEAAHARLSNIADQADKISAGIRQHLP